MYRYILYIYIDYIIDLKNKSGLLVGWSHNFPSSFQEWVAKKLNVRIIVVSGILRPGLLAPQVFNTDPQVKQDVWLWLHDSVDGDGHRSPHFSLVSQDCLQDASVTKWSHIFLGKAVTSPCSDLFGIQDLCLSLVCKNLEGIRFVERGWAASSITFASQSSSQRWSCVRWGLLFETARLPCSF